MLKKSFDAHVSAMLTPRLSKGYSQNAYFARAFSGAV